MRWVISAGAALMAWWTVALGTLAPLQSDDLTQPVQYVFVWPGEPVLARAAAFTLIVLAMVFAGVVGVARRRAADGGAAARTGRWLAPLVAIAMVLLGLAPAVPGIGEPGAVLAFFFYDLRWWWFVVALIWVTVRAARAIAPGLALGSAVSAIVRSYPRTLLFGLVVSWAIVATPPLRFNAALHGDEPKYVRYLELWYQGQGLDVSRKARLTELPSGATSRLFANGAHVADAVATDARALVSDVRGFLENPFGFRWNRASGGEGFLNGRHGGVYQIHQPGLSFLLVPGYLIDRSRPSLEPGYQDEFPSRLVATGANLLLIYGLSAIALYGLLRRALGAASLAWGASALAMMSLPVSAFAFQFYPETPAALIVLFVSTYVLFLAPEARARSTALAGAAAGGLLWLHPRFLLVSGVLAVAGAWATPGRRRRWWVAGYGCVAFTELAYVYHVTGSWLPTAFYDASATDTAINPSGIPGNLVGYLFNGIWGLSPHAPWALAAIPGLVILWRDAPRHACFVIAVTLSLLIPAAGHGLAAAGGTPGRFIVAIVPLLMWPAARMAQWAWHSVNARALTVIVAVLSLEASWAYLRHHVKDYGPMRAPGASGWRPNMAFPDVSGRLADVSWPDLVIFSAILLILGWWSWRIARPPVSPAAPHRGVASVVVVAVIALTTAASGARGRWTRPDFLPDDAAAKNRVAAAMVSVGRCRLCFATSNAQVDWTWLTPNPAREGVIDLGVEGRHSHVLLTLESQGRRQGFGRMSVAWGDGTEAEWTGVVVTGRASHRYAQAGEYNVNVQVHVPSGIRTERRTIRVD